MTVAESSPAESLQRKQESTVNYTERYTYDPAVTASRRTSDNDPPIWLVRLDDRHPVGLITRGTTGSSAFSPPAPTTPT